MEFSEEAAYAALKTEIKLQINQRLYDSRIITKEFYEEAKLKIVTGVTDCERMTSGYHIKKPGGRKDTLVF